MSACIVGWGHSRFGRSPDNLETMIVKVARQAMADAGICGNDVDAIWLGHFNGGLVPENFCASLTLQADDGLRWKPATRVENACGTGSAAIHAAMDAIEAGRIRVALVVGAEKMTAVPGPEVTRVLGNASYVSEEAARGMTFPGLFGEIAQAYFEAYGDHSATLARIAAKNHANGSRNPMAHIQKDIGFEYCNTVSESNPYIAAPLRKTDCSLVSDGAAAIIITDEATAKTMSKAVRIRARAHVNDFLPMSRKDITAFEGPRRAIAQVLNAAGIKVDDLSFAEVHDCFTMAELLIYEAMGLAKPGQGVRALDSGLVYADGGLPVNPSGGLKAKGHPIGATGVSMHALAAMQLCGEAGAMQLRNPELAMVFNMGGTAVANYASILERAA